MLKAIAESFGVTVYSRFIDAINNEPEEEQTGDEIALDIIQRAGLRVKA